MNHESPNVNNDSRTKNRQKWHWTIDGTIFAIGATLGLNTVWTFPYRMMRSGGFVFFILYILFMVIFGLPIAYLQLLIGQYGGLAPHLTFHRMAPITTGVGVSMTFVCLIMVIYSNVITAWIIRYIVASFTAHWSHCNNEWNTDMCSVPGNYSLDKQQSPGDEFFDNILRLSHTSFEFEVGLPLWDLVLCLGVAWILVFVCFIVGVKSAAKIMYVLVALPFLVMALLFVRGVTLEGSVDGLISYLTPDITRVTSINVVSSALNRVLFTFSFGAGVLPTIGSYNRFRNFVIRDAIILIVTNILVTFLFGLVISCYIGYYAHHTNMPIYSVISSGPYLVFVPMADIFGSLPGTTIWALMWYIALLFLALGPQLAYVNVVLTAICDQFPIFQRFPFTLIVNGGVCFICFLFGIIFVCPGGSHIFSFVDIHIHVSLAVLLLTLLQIIAVCYIHGFWRLAKDICLMMGIRPNSILVFRFSVNPVWLVLFSIVAPILLVILLIINLIYWHGISVFPVWVRILFGWLFITFLPLALIAIVGVLMILYALVKKKGLLWLIRPTEYWTARENNEIEVIPMHRRGGQILSPPPDNINTMGKVYPDK